MDHKFQTINCKSSHLPSLSNTQAIRLLGVPSARKETKIKNL